MNGLHVLGFDDVDVVDARLRGPVEPGGGREPRDERRPRLVRRRIADIIPIEGLDSWLAGRKTPPEAIFHMGACSSTTETNADYLMANNVHYSTRLFEYCTDHAIPFIYASSAATYGAMEQGFDDCHALIPDLRPINKYGYSKQLFDCQVLRAAKTPPFWAGLKFFNVYGPQESHKGSQASVVWHAYPQIRDQGRLRLFKSYRDGIDHGEQKRDFVYVKDVVKVMLHLFDKQDPEASGIYNVGTGQARSFADLGRAVFSAMDRAPEFEWIDMPDNIRNQYQYFTQASLGRLREKAGYQTGFLSLEDGIRDYVQEYLQKEPWF